MSASPGVLGTFQEPGAAADAIRALRAAGFVVRAAMPTPYPEVAEAIGKPRSAIHHVTLTGALVGLACGTLLTVWCSLAWPLFTGGKPIVSAPAFAIVVFEVAVFVGSLVNLVALAIASWRAGGFPSFPAREALEGDRVRLFAVGGEAADAERILRARGAEGVRRVA